jgi:hypothetical protein
MVLSVLGCATRSIHDFVRPELQTLLAIACGDRNDRTMQPLASRSESNHPFGERWG